MASAVTVARKINSQPLFNHNLQAGGAFLYWNPSLPQGLALLNAEVTKQASIIGYLDDFKLLFVVSLMMLPLLLLMRQPKGELGPPDPGAMGH